MSTVTFKSEVDFWLAIAFGILPVLALHGLYDYGDPGGILLGWTLIALSLALSFIYLFPLRYELTETALVVRFGVFRNRCDYSDIVRVGPSLSLLSAPALSVDRIAIVTRTSADIVISPKGRQEFLSALDERCPHLKLVGEKLVSPAEAENEKNGNGASSWWPPRL